MPLARGMNVKNTGDKVIFFLPDVHDKAVEVLTVLQQ